MVWIKTHDASLGLGYLPSLLWYSVWQCPNDPADFLLSGSDAVEGDSFREMTIKIFQCVCVYVSARSAQPGQAG